MVDILLVQPPLPKPMYEYSGSLIVTPPLGLGYIASKLRQDGLSVETVDMAILDLDLVELKQKLQRMEPKIVGIASETLTSKNALKIADLVRRSTMEAGQY